MIVQSSVDSLQQLLHFLLNSILLGSLGCLLGILSQQDNDVSRRLSTSSNTSQLNTLMTDELILDRSRGNVLALGGLENLLGTSRDLETAHIIQLSLVSSTQEAIIGHCLLGSLLILIVSHHHSRSFDLKLSIRGNALDDPRVGLTDVSNTATSGLGNVRIVEVLRHTVPLQQLQSQVTVPRQQIRRKRSTSTSSIPHTLQSQGLQQLLLHQETNERNLQQLLQLLRRHLLKHSLLELGPKARHRQEYGGFASPEILHKGGERIGKKDVFPRNKWDAFANPTFHTVRHGKVREVTIPFGDVKSFNESKRRFCHRIKTEHHSLRNASTSTSVDNGGHLLSRPLLHLLNLLSLASQILPLIIIQSDRTQRERYTLHPLGNSLLHFVPGVLVQLANEEQLGFTVFERVLGRLGSQRGVNRNTNMTRHHDCQIGHEPPSTILTHDGNLTGHGKSHALNVSGHLFRFGEKLGKGPVLHVHGVASHGLREEDLVGVFGTLVEDVVGDDFAGFLLGELGCHVE
mmetsp:Transcript_22057/g.47868  ORF Transcript_22057/g.47868 Transcript_22057/m.47868 type:complete len:516 (-) Transcript_22057:85-1632(-)